MAKISFRACRFSLLTVRFVGDFKGECKQCCIIWPPGGPWFLGASQRFRVFCCSATYSVDVSSSSLISVRRTGVETRGVVIICSFETSGLLQPQLDL